LVAYLALGFAAAFSLFSCGLLIGWLIDKRYGKRDQRGNDEASN